MDHKGTLETKFTDLLSGMGGRASFAVWEQLPRICIQSRMVMLTYTHFETSVHSQTILSFACIVFPPGKAAGFASPRIHKYKLCTGIVSG